MRTITDEQFNNALAFLRNRHKVEVSQAASSGGGASSSHEGTASEESRVIIDGQAVQREDVVRMAETEGWSDSWKPSDSPDR